MIQSICDKFPLKHRYQDFADQEPVEPHTQRNSNRELHTLFEVEEEEEEQEKGPEGEKKGWLRLYVFANTKAPSKKPKWQDKWCHLTNGRLIFRVSPNIDVEPAATKLIEMGSMVSVELSESGSDQVIMKSAKQTYYLVTRSPKDACDWVENLLVGRTVSISRAHS